MGQPEMNRKEDHEVLVGRDVPELGDGDSAEEVTMAAEDAENRAAFVEELERTSVEALHDKIASEDFTHALELATAKDSNYVEGMVRVLGAKINDLEQYRDPEGAPTLAAEIDKDIAQLEKHLDMAMDRLKELRKTIPIAEGEMGEVKGEQDPREFTDF
jgi:hypothetical protein